MTVIADEGSFLKSENGCFSISKNEFMNFKNNLETIRDNMIWKKLFFKVFFTDKPYIIKNCRG